jgi:hypothetical protein
LPDLFLVPEYVTEAEEERLARSATSARGAWVQLSGRCVWGEGGCAPLDVKNDNFWPIAPPPRPLAAPPPP